MPPLPVRQRGPTTNRTDRNSLAALRHGPAFSAMPLRRPGNRCAPLTASESRIRHAGGLGSTANGLHRERAGAQVPAPCERGVYAGPFRSTDNSLHETQVADIMCCSGDGTNSVDLAVCADRGNQWRSWGAPQSPRPSRRVPATGLYRSPKDGAPVDPGPWWASDSEKVRG